MEFRYEHRNPEDIEIIDVYDRHRLEPHRPLDNKLQALRIALIKRCGLTEIPSYILTAHTLTTLSLQFNIITEIPDGIAELTNLTHLDLTENLVTSIPDALSKCVNLRELLMPDNDLTELPVSIANLINLKCLMINNNKITSLPSCICKMSHLKEIHIMDNMLCHLPARIGDMCNLKVLDVARNKLRAIPESIGQLKQLTGLYLGGNLYTTLPETLLQLTHLKRLGFGMETSACPPHWIALFFVQNKLDRLQIDHYAIQHMATPEFCHALCTLDTVLHTCVSIPFYNLLETKTKLLRWTAFKDHYYIPWSPKRHASFPVHATHRIACTLWAATRGNFVLPVELWWEILEFLCVMDFSPNAYFVN